MILINLLPPELRRRQSGVSPMFVSVVAGGGVCLLLLVIFAYVQFIRIPSSEALLSDKKAELVEKTKKAAEVLELEKQIADANERRQKIVGLMLRKVYWAKTIDEFVTLLNGPWTAQGFDVRCLDLTVNEGAAPGERRGATGPDTVNYQMVWRYKLLGKEVPLAGDYIKSFFETINASKFWSEQGFTDKPDKTYRGDQPRPNAKIGRVVIEGTLDWTRVKVIKEPKR
jgi:hypothetical protein